MHGCMAGMVGQDNLLVKKVWKLVSNDADLINIMNKTFACDGSHVHSQRFDLKATQTLPASLCTRCFGSSEASLNSQAQDGLESFFWRVLRTRSRSGHGLRTPRTELGLWRLPRDEERTGLCLDRNVSVKRGSWFS